MQIKKKGHTKGSLFIGFWKKLELWNIDIDTIGDTQVMYSDDLYC